MKVGCIGRYLLLFLLLLRSECEEGVTIVTSGDDSYVPRPFNPLAFSGAAAVGAGETYHNDPVAVPSEIGSLLTAAMALPVDPPDGLLYEAYPEGTFAASMFVL